MAVQQLLFATFLPAGGSSEGEAWFWGGNSGGELGVGTKISHSSPVQVGALTTWTMTTIGGSNGGGVTSDGKAWVWGGNTKGQLAKGTTTIPVSSPIQVGSLTDWQKILTGINFFIGLKTDGTIWSWGDNATSGMLGHGDVVLRSSPVQIGALTTWADIFVNSGQRHVFATTTAGTLFSWGNDENGALGHGTANVHISSPTQVGALTDWLSVAVSNQWSLAIKTDATRWAWGVNGNGELAMGDVVYRSSPVQVGALTTWAGIGLGGAHAWGVDTAGRLWINGDNANGSLGLGTSGATDVSSPVQVGALTDWVADLVSGGTGNSYLRKSDGTLWGWGINNTGSLALGNALKVSSPTQVGSLTTWIKLAENGGYNAYFSAIKTA